MQKIIIVDDEVNICNYLEKIIKTHFKNKIILSGIANNTSEAKLLIEKYNPDIALFDIHIPEVNAIEFLKNNKINANVIFITAHDEYAIQAFKVHAIDFLTKPVNEAELVESLNWLLQYGNTSNAQIQQQLRQLDERTKITINTKDGKFFIDFNTIVYIEAFTSYSKFYYKGNDKLKYLVASKPLSYFEDILNMPFVRIHKSYIVNSDYVQKIESGNKVVLDGNIVLDIARRRLPEVSKMFERK